MYLLLNLLNLLCLLCLLLNSVLRLHLFALLMMKLFVAHCHSFFFFFSTGAMDVRQAAARATYCEQCTASALCTLHGIEWPVFY